jgi:putative hydrolase of HD superfamily
MLTKALILKVFDAASMQRWNDKFRPMEMTELDKQAHKMIVAFVIGKLEEDKPDFSWLDVIEGGLFELLQRIVLTDIKPPVFYRIREDPDRYAELNRWVYKQLYPVISPLGRHFCRRFKSYFTQVEQTTSRRVLGAAHFYATAWEFAILRQANPNGYEMDEIEQRLEEQQQRYYDLEGMKQVVLFPNYRRFISLAGELRFQVRWSNLYRIPKTSVLGHMLFVAILSYLFSLEIKACEKRRVNNYLTGLFHDFPEVLTRDIVSPVKRSVTGLDRHIKRIENEFMLKEVYRLLPKGWHAQIKTFAEDEFSDIATINGKRKKLPTDAMRRYNKDVFDPRDGSLVKAADDLAAYVEAQQALAHGINRTEFQEALVQIRNKYRDKMVAGLNLDQLYAQFT